MAYAHLLKTNPLGSKTLVPENASAHTHFTTERRSTGKG
jgi:hypothetical protein